MIRRFFLLVIAAALFGAPVFAFAASSCAFVRDLTVGSKGEDVKCLQSVLDVAPQSGFFGPATKAAVAGWQKRSGVSPASGYFGARSRAAFAGAASGGKKISAADLEISGWIPYWKKASGTPEALAHLDTFKELNPFGFTVKNDGTLVDLMKLDEDPWPQLVREAKAKKVRVIPTIMTSNTEGIHKILSNKKLRDAHIKEIVAMVKKYDFDGVDIDYEGKKADTRPYFSAFLRDLYKAIGKKWVMCTIESRIPLDSRFSKIPKEIAYANDYNAINSYCDRVRIMAYDQGSIDIKLNQEKRVSGPYAPIADPDWVRKAVEFTAKTISKKKIVIGVATYGYEYEVEPFGKGYSYDRLHSFNPRYALQIGAEKGIQPTRNQAGELSILYQDGGTVPKGPDVGDPVQMTPGVHDAGEAGVVGAVANGALIATGTSPVASSTGPLRLLWWSDSQAIADKVKLAKELGVRGVAVFKIDGGYDPQLWEVLR